MAIYVNCLYIPVPHALTCPSPADKAAILNNPYCVGFDGIYPMLRKEAVEKTLDEIHATFSAFIRSVCSVVGKQPHELNVGQLSRALNGRLNIKPGVKHDIHVTKPIVPCNTQSAEDDIRYTVPRTVAATIPTTPLRPGRIKEHCEQTAVEKGHSLEETVIHEHCDGAAFKLSVCQKVSPFLSPDSL